MKPSLGTESMPDIQRLAANVVNKIAAGEVVERPASIVKELMENAIDAGASRVDVELQQGGTSRIRIVDDGCGIPADQLTLAVASHATSKIRSDDDLFRIDTLGFRGEALASIASVSRLKLRSRVPDEDSGAQLEVHGGQVSPTVPCGCPPGTMVEVEDLFFNTPVRRKFMRSTQTEMGHATEAFVRLALANPAIHFTLTHGDRLLHDLTPVDRWRDRIGLFFGIDLAESLIAIEGIENETRVSGYVANPTHSRGNNRMQYLFINGRYFRDRSLQHALGEAYRGLLLTGRFPIGFLRIDMPPEMVDVNVHPTKLEVKFQDGGRLYSQLLGTLRTRFLNTDLTARINPEHGAPHATGQRPSAAPLPVPGRVPDAFAAAAAGAPTSTAAVHPLSARQTLLPHAPAQFPARDFPAADRSSRMAPVAMQQPPAAPNADKSLAADARMEGAPVEGAPVEEARVEGAAEPTEENAPRAMQVLNRYLIAETDEGVVVIDQHALHERIIYEQLRQRVQTDAMETQNLLVPEPVDLSAAEAAAIIDASDLLGQLAVKVEPFGGGTVLVSSYPAMLANFSPAELLRSLADHLTSGRKAPERRDILDQLLHMISCKAAIKAGDRLSPDEVTALLAQRNLAQDAHHCPHGRPTALVFTQEELDRQFKRT